MDRLDRRAFVSLVVCALAFGLILFAGAGTFHYWQAWLFLAMFFGTSSAMTAYLARHDRALLERRMKGGMAAEPTARQKIIMTFASLCFFALLLVPGLDRRFDWSAVPSAMVVIGDGMIVAGFYWIHLVFKENTFAAATVQIAEGQIVISTGPYARVRHPMYSGALLYLLGMPLALGSWWGLPVFLIFVPFLVWRMIDEERFMARDLPGYGDYCRSVRWRLVPHLF